ncbi:MAG TPA: hypothetical protein VHK28_02275 [Candidatus Limnocylindria bacterium]|nr:hypothetical protein [Candidatus Limnocylindria bacterium]
MPVEQAMEASSVAEVPVVLPSSHRLVTVPVYIRSEEPWAGDLPDGFNRVPNRPALTFEGSALYPELIVVKLLERAGWHAAWRKTWNTVEYWRDIGVTVEPSALAVNIVDHVSRQAGHAPPWNIVAWHGRQLRLLVSRVGERHRTSGYLANWLDAALRLGIPLACFSVVEHRIEHVPAPRRR